jgi:hypothetical protein
MRPRLAVVFGLAAFGFSEPAWADDLAEALNYAANIMGDDIVEGYEDFMDWDETEALPILLAKKVVPGEPPEAYGTDSAGFERSDFFQTLGSERLDFATLRSFIEEASEETGLPVPLIDAVIRTESGYRVGAVSNKGARGLMQLMPETANEVGIDDPMDPRQNILGGARYLKKMYDQFGSLELAIAAYNAGPNAVKKHDGIPPFQETRRYVATVIHRYQNKIK